MPHDRPLRDPGPIRLSGRERPRPAPAPRPATAAAPASAPILPPTSAPASASRQPPAAPAAAPGLPPIERARARELCQWFELDRLCIRQRCRRAGACRGEPVACLRAGLAQAPAALAEFARRLLQAQADGLDAETAFEQLADYHDVFFAWTAGLAACRPDGGHRRTKPQSPHAPGAAAGPV